ncbi:LapA family protein [Cellulomonas alba]|uniref:LapA family protein n=1 Tax=Cellulomonas alba TaxID=3053467 RepID=A0ABT7SEI7_9CELL|nr:LapA family protein [Cellulomonas alba]MDM7854605.1 LapA family protein [Cellulomonas alba]
MSAPDQKVERSNGVSWRLVVGIVLLAAVLVLVLQNTKETTFELFWMSVSAPLWILVVASLVLGFLIGWLLRSRRSKRRANV